MKTIKEGALDHILNTMGEFLHKDQSFSAGVEFAQRWIPVKEELPELKSIVLCVNGFSPFIAIYEGEQDGFRIPNTIGEYTVTHWRPIERI